MPPPKKQNPKSKEPKEYGPAKSTVYDRGNRVYTDPFTGKAHVYYPSSSLSDPLPSNHAIGASYSGLTDRQMGINDNSHPFFGPMQGNYQRDYPVVIYDPEQYGDRPVRSIEFIGGLNKPHAAERARRLYSDIPGLKTWPLDAEYAKKAPNYDDSLSSQYLEMVHPNRDFYTNLEYVNALDEAFYAVRPKELEFNQLRGGFSDWPPYTPQRLPAQWAPNWQRVPQSTLFQGPLPNNVFFRPTSGAGAAGASGAGGGQAPSSGGGAGTPGGWRSFFSRAGNAGGGSVPPGGGGGNPAAAGGGKLPPTQWSFQPNDFGRQAANTLKGGALLTPIGMGSAYLDALHQGSTPEEAKRAAMYTGAAGVGLTGLGVAAPAAIPYVAGGLIGADAARDAYRGVTGKNLEMTSDQSAANWVMPVGGALGVASMLNPYTAIPTVAYGTYKLAKPYADEAFLRQPVNDVAAYMYKQDVATDRGKQFERSGGVEANRAKRAAFGSGKSEGKAGGSRSGSKGDRIKKAVQNLPKYPHPKQTSTGNPFMSTAKSIGESFSDPPNRPPVRSPFQSPLAAPEKRPPVRSPFQRVKASGGSTR